MESTPTTLEETPSVPTAYAHLSYHRKDIIAGVKEMLSKSIEMNEDITEILLAFNVPLKHHKEAFFKKLTLPKLLSLLDNMDDFKGRAGNNDEKMIIYMLSSAKCGLYEAHNLMEEETWHEVREWSLKRSQKKDENSVWGEIVAQLLMDSGVLTEREAVSISRAVNVMTFHSLSPPKFNTPEWVSFCVLATTFYVEVSRTRARLEKEEGEQILGIEKTITENLLKTIEKPKYIDLAGSVKSLKEILAERNQLEINSSIFNNLASLTAESLDFLESGLNDVKKARKIEKVETAEDEETELEKQVRETLAKQKEKTDPLSDATTAGNFFRKYNNRNCLLVSSWNTNGFRTAEDPVALKELALHVKQMDVFCLQEIGATNGLARLRSLQALLPGWDAKCSPASKNSRGNAVMWGPQWSLVGSCTGFLSFSNNAERFPHPPQIVLLENNVFEGFMICVVSLHTSPSGSVNGRGSTSSENSAKGKTVPKKVAIKEPITGSPEPPKPNKIIRNEKAKILEKGPEAASPTDEAAASSSVSLEASLEDDSSPPAPQDLTSEVPLEKTAGEASKKETEKEEQGMVGRLRAEVNDTITATIETLKSWKVPYNSGSRRDTGRPLPLIILAGDFNLYPGTSEQIPGVRSLVPGVPSSSSSSSSSFKEGTPKRSERIAENLRAPKPSEYLDLFVAAGSPYMKTTRSNTKGKAGTHCDNFLLNKDFLNNPETTSYPQVRSVVLKGDKEHSDHDLVELYLQFDPSTVIGNV